MILKIKKNSECWIYFDKIKRVDSIFSNSYGIVKLLDPNNDNPYLQICKLSDNCDKNGVREPIVSSSYFVNEYILNGEELLKQSSTNEYGNLQYWNVKIFTIWFENDSIQEIACGGWNSDIYLLNDEGKTLERL